MADQAESEAGRRSLISLLGADADEARRLLKDTDSPYSRRTFVRAVAASVEGIIHEFRRHTLVEAERRPSLFSAGELACLREESYSIDDQGHARASARYVPVPASVQFTLRMFMRGTKCGPTLKLDHQGWEAFRRMIKLRNRLMHPRGPEDLEVSDDDLTIVETGYRWFMATIATNLLGAYDETKAALRGLDDSGMSRDAEQGDEADEAFGGTRVR
jgi:hypothetical protein